MPQMTQAHDIKSGDDSFESLPKHPANALFTNNLHTGAIRHCGMQQSMSKAFTATVFAKGHLSGSKR